MNASHPLRAGLRPVRGSKRLVLLRWSLIVLAGLPALALGTGGVGDTVARSPYFVDVTGREPLVPLIRLLGGLPGSVWAGLGITLALAFVGQQLLAAGALAWLAPERVDDAARPRLLSSVLRDGRHWFWTMLRVAILAALLAGLGAWVLSSIFERLGDHGRVAGWTGRTLQLTLPLLHAALLVAWLALVGAWGLWCRLLSVADARRTVRSTGLLVLRVWWRRPLRGPVFYAAATLATVVLGAVVVVAWRQAPPATVSGARVWMLLWLLALLAQAAVWHWLLRAGRLLYAGAEFDDLRRRPDGPWGVLRWVRSRLPARRGRPRENAQQLSREDP